MKQVNRKKVISSGRAKIIKFLVMKYSKELKFRVVADYRQDVTLATPLIFVTGLLNTFLTCNKTLLYNLIL